MYKAGLEFGSFDDASSLDFRERALQFLLEAWTNIDMLYLLEHPETPPMYSLFPKYILKVRPFDLDTWQDVARTIQLRTGDCKDFACWRCAELRLQGHDVYPIISTSQYDNATVYHIQVYRPADGEVEDPSVIFGMPEEISYDQLRNGE